MALMVASNRCSAASRRPISVSGAEAGQDDFELAGDDAALRVSRAAP